METWKIENIPIPQIKLTVEPMDDGSLKLVSEICGRITTEIAEFKSEAIRQQLIKLGWTPPDE